MNACCLHIYDYKNPFNFYRTWWRCVDNRKNEEKHTLKTYDIYIKEGKKSGEAFGKSFKISFFKVKEFLLSFCARSSLSFSLFYMQTNKQANLNITQQNKNKIDKTNKQERRKRRKEKEKEGRKTHHS